METLAQAAFTGGSVWIGNQEEIEPHIELGRRLPIIAHLA